LPTSLQHDTNCKKKTHPKIPCSIDYTAMYFDFYLFEDNVVSKYHRFHIKRFSLEKLEVEDKKVELSNRFAASENLDNEVDINSAQEII
jgi:hypothetical protein